MMADQDSQTDGTSDIDSNIQVLDEDILEQLDGSVSQPSLTQKDNIFKFFRQILKLPDSTKVANLQDIEVGKMHLSMRSYKELTVYAKAENLNVVSLYLNAKAEIMASTSMGRKGFFLQTSVTQIRKDQKIQSNPQVAKTGYWDRNKPQQPQGE